MAKELKVDPNKWKTVEDIRNEFDEQWANLLMALDEARCNWLDSAAGLCDLFDLGHAAVRNQLNTEFPKTPDYRYDPELFIKFLQRMAQLYKKQGN